MRYEIREIVDFVQRIQELDPLLHIENENIGDPIAKGWPVPPFLPDLIAQEMAKPGYKVFGYTHSRGNPETRKWICRYVKRFCPSFDLDSEDILMTSGLGAGISAMYHMLGKGKRVIQPSPSYPTHAFMEAFAAGEESISYRLDPNNGWQPDLQDLEQKIVNHPEIVGILLINPNNPTGAVYSKKTLESIVKIAEKYELMIISDEIYFRMIYNAHQHAQITEIAKSRVPLIVMRGLSKDVPWPGARCGWLEFHNQHLDKDFKVYCESIKKRILMEVCSVTLPQIVMPQIYDHPDFEDWMAHYLKSLEDNSNQITKILSSVKGLKVNRTNGAFYMLPIFEEGVLSDRQSLPIANEKVRVFVEEKVSSPDIPLDKRFVYYLAAATGVIVVPASGFFSSYDGFRLTTLNRDPKRRDEIYLGLAKAIETYLNSDKGQSSQQHKSEVEWSFD